ncbi:MAG: hypothetical protein CM1200mP14_18900 [Gammaproteobacteria bacterium]|nr:MAG: hypothetical protein CM1200mP14_18900 [Gammaproteobacteria bacterium]
MSPARSQGRSTAEGLRKMQKWFRKSLICSSASVNWVFQEFETQRYLTGILEDHGFEIELGVARNAKCLDWGPWSNGSGSPVIALGSGVDGIPQSNQKPGVAYRDPILSMAPGHGEGHKIGAGCKYCGALNVKELMEREDIDGTLMIWPGVAEEQLGSKAFFVRDGVFDGVDVNLFSHVSSNFSVTWGHTSGNALVSAQFRFTGETAHSAGSPWGGKSALGRSHASRSGLGVQERKICVLRKRSHYIIVEGGDQPNVVPQTATIWFYFREVDYPRVVEMYDAAKLMARGAAMMTGTEIDTIMTVGSAWNRHFSKPVAEVTQTNIERSGFQNGPRQICLSERTPA